MKEAIFIFSFNREEMLKNVISCVKNLNYWIIDDGSDFKLDDPKFIQFPHGGKEKFAEKYDYALKLAEKTNADFYMFVQDDFLNLNMDGIFSIHNELKHNPYVCSVINDGRQKCWNGIMQKQINDHLYQIGFVDGSFFFNRSAIDEIGWYMNPVDPNRFIRNRMISAGEGEQLTVRFVRNNVNMYKPIKSLALHTMHESTMNPGTITKLVSL